MKLVSAKENKKKKKKAFSRVRGQDCYVLLTQLNKEIRISF